MKRTVRALAHWVMGAIVGVAGLAESAHASDPPRVVASILPIHALTAMVMGDVGAPVLLVPPGASPHAFALKPSGAAALADAELVVWIGPGFETFLEGVLDSVAPRARRLTLLDGPGLVTWPVRGGGVWDEHGDGDEHAGDAIDGHLWLDPRNARVIVAHVAEALAAIDPTRAATYAANADAAEAALDRLDAELAADLAPVRERPYFVFHDAFQYFERRYGLRAAGAITLHPEQPPSAQRLIAIRQRIAALDSPCVFAEPQFSDKIVAVATEATDARAGTVDPLGVGPPGPQAYAATLRALAAALVDCLVRPATH